MKLISVFGKGAGAKDDRIDFRIRCLRFRRMLEQARLLKALLADGREKMEGEYILDRHYMESLADDAIERVSGMVFDSCVLVPPGGEDLYERFDRQVSRVRNLLDPKEEPREKEAAGREEIEPEYRLLSRILDWLGGDANDGGESLDAFAGRILDRTAALDREVPPPAGAAVETAGAVQGGVRNTIRIVRFEGVADRAEEGGAPGAGSESRPLRLLLKGAGKGAAPEARAGGSREREWIAAVDGRHVSLRRVDSEIPIRLEILPAADASAAVLFLFAPPNFPPDRLPSGFKAERSEAGVHAWLEIEGLEEFEVHLVRLGAFLFAGGLEG